jgi:hypothetical protein
MCGFRIAAKVDELLPFLSCLQIVGVNAQQFDKVDM